jgi:hypothetical protein
MNRRRNNKRKKKRKRRKEDATLCKMMRDSKTMPLITKTKEAQMGQILETIWIISEQSECPTEYIHSSASNSNNTDQIS